MYLYTLNLPSNQEEIACLECLVLTGVRTRQNFVLGPDYADIKNSAYMDTCTNIYFEDSCPDSLYNKIAGLNYDMDGFCIKFVNTDTHIDFKTRKNIESRIADIFPGRPDLKNPIDEFVITIIDGMWMFGKVESKTENRWTLHNKKPHTFCNSLNSRMSRALVNIAAMNKKDIKLIDPCCGMGTVLIEALDMGIDAYGFDINSVVADSANKNLEFFGFPPRAKCQDATAAEGQYDTSVIDLPYGLLSKDSRYEYFDILSNTRKICRRSVILSAEDISETIISSGFDILETCISHKGGLDRHITVCEKRE